MKCSLGISNFLKEISSLSYSVVFLYLFALIAEEAFISPCYSLELCIQMLISFLFSLAFHFSYFGWVSKITADGYCSHEIKRCLLLGRKVMTNLDSIFKSRDITVPTKVRLVKAMVFPVVIYGCESWTVKKAEH